MRHTLFQRQVFCDVQQPLHCKDCTYVSDERGPQHNWQKCLYSCCCICTHPSLLHSGMMAMHLLNRLLLHTFHFAVIEGCELIVCYIDHYSSYTPSICLGQCWRTIGPNIQAEEWTPHLLQFTGLFSLLNHCRLTIVHCVAVSSIN